MTIKAAKETEYKDRKSKKQDYRYDDGESKKISFDDDDDDDDERRVRYWKCRNLKRF
jgi:hypothetical protein